jgi:tRNA threonylcarbamoyladenosine biosynthesis protein TsaB
MSIILNIDCSTETASVCVAENGTVLHSISNSHQKDHAAFLHNAIHDILKKSLLELRSLAAIAVASGPGSYTGLRVAMASAKGLCYALEKPFITVGSLNILANAAILATKDEKLEQSLYCPMIDARRMEVYTALFDNEMAEITTPHALILDENSFSEQLKTNKIFFFGNGAAKFEGILLSKNAIFLPVGVPDFSMSILSFKKFKEKNFTGLIDSEPLYIKEFHSSPDLFNKK